MFALRVHKAIPVQHLWTAWLDRDSVMAGWLNHTLAEPHGLQDNCWSVKVESCGCTVLISCDCRFFSWESSVFLLNDSPFSLLPNSPTIDFLPVMVFYQNKKIFRERFSRKMCFSSTALSVLLSPFSYLFFRLSLNLKSKICLNWLQRALGGFVSTVMRVLIGPEARAANTPLLVCRGLLLAR